MWEKVEFSEIVKDITGGNKKLSKENYLPFGIYPIVDQGEKFIGGYYNTDITLKIKGPVIVFGDHSKCIKYIDFDFIFGADGIKVLEPKPNLNTKFLFHFLQTVHLPDVGYSRHYKFLKESRIPLPPLPIQEKIAAILDKADELRLKDQELQDKYDELAQAIFIDMFGDPVRNEKGWEVKRLEDLTSKIHSGNTPKGGSAVYTKTGIQFYRSQNVWKNRLDLDDIAFIDEATHLNMRNSSLMFRDILITKTGRINTENSSLGRAAMFLGADNTANINGHVYLIRINSSDINHSFVLYILTSIQYRDYIRKVCVGGIDKRQLNKEHIESFPIITPPLHLQEEFAKKIELINNLKAKANTERSEELFQSLLQRAFKGELVSKTQLTE